MGRKPLAVTQADFVSTHNARGLRWEQEEYKYGCQIKLNANSTVKAEFVQRFQRFPLTDAVL